MRPPLLVCCPHAGRVVLALHIDKDVILCCSASTYIVIALRCQASLCIGTLTRALEFCCAVLPAPTK